jgi:hypothetical protein
LGQSLFLWCGLVARGTNDVDWRCRSPPISTNVGVAHRSNQARANTRRACLLSLTHKPTQYIRSRPDLSNRKYVNLYPLSDICVVDSCLPPHRWLVVPLSARKSVFAVGRQKTTALCSGSSMRVDFILRLRRNVGTSLILELLRSSSSLSLHGVPR